MRSHVRPGDFVQADMGGISATVTQRPGCSNNDNLVVFRLRTGEIAMVLAAPGEECGNEVLLLLRNRIGWTHVWQLAVVTHGAR